MDASEIRELAGKLDLSLIMPILRQQATDAFIEGDWLGLLCSSENHYGMSIVIDNFSQLLKRGIFEPALLHAFSATRTNNHGISPSVIQFLFSRCDRNKLMAAGDALPDGDKFTIYRGVSGSGAARRVRGYSWTDDIPTAAWFALRFNLGDPAVFRATVDRSEILAFVEDRQEREFIVRPINVKRVKLTPEGLQQQSDICKNRRSPAAGPSFT